MLEDVRLAADALAPIEFFGRMGGVMPMPDEVLDAVRKAMLSPRVNGYRLPRRGGEPICVN